MRADSRRFKSIRERDVDLLLIEELTVTPPFREWLLDALEIDSRSVDEVLGVWHSVSDTELGESDVEVGLQLNGGRRLLLLIENKIDASFQDAQLQRYRERGRKAVDGNWDEFSTVLFAPRSYLATARETDVVDGTLAYEDVREWFDARDARRAAYKADVLTEAIEQNRRGYVSEPDEAVTAIHRQYWAIANEAFPELGMEQPDGVPSGNLWVRFKPRALPADVQLVHKMGRGDVDLQFSGAAESAEEFVEKYEPQLEQDMRIERTGKSMAVRIAVPTIATEGAASDQDDEMRSGLAAAHRLLDWYRE